MMLMQAQENLITILSTTIVVRCSALITAFTSSCSVMTPSSSLSISVMISSTKASALVRLFFSVSGIKWWRVVTIFISSSLLISPLLSSSNTLNSIYGWWTIFLHDIHLYLPSTLSPKYLTDLCLRGSVIHDGHHHKKLWKSYVPVTIDVIELEHKILKISLEIKIFYFEFLIFIFCFPIKTSVTMTLPLNRWEITLYLLKYSFS